MTLDDILKEIFHGSEKVFHTATVGDLIWGGIKLVSCTETNKMSSEASMVCGMLNSLLPPMVTEHEPGVFKMAYFRHVSGSRLYFSSLRSQKKE